MDSAYNTRRLSKQSIYFYRITIHPKNITIKFLEILMYLWCALEKKNHQETFLKFIIKQISCLFTPLSFQLGYLRYCCDLVPQIGVHHKNMVTWKLQSGDSLQIRRQSCQGLSHTDKVFLIILFQNIFLIACNGCFGLFSKKGSGASLWCTFSAWFLHLNFPYLILHQWWTKFQCHTLFLSQHIKQNVLLSSHLDNYWWNYKPSLSSTSLSSISKAMADREKKRARKYKYLNISRTKRAFYF